jgi:hypothetical protein
MTRLASLAEDRAVSKDTTNDDEPLPGSTLPWTLHEKPQFGVIRTRPLLHRRRGPFRNGAHDPDSAARYALAVALEIRVDEITIYEPLRGAIAELQAETEEAEVEIELEVD